MTASHDAPGSDTPTTGGRHLLSRRTVLAGLGGGAAVIGWSPARRSWITAADASAARAGAGARVAPAPHLDGSLETAPEVLAAFAGDFGRVVRRTPTAVLRPGSVRDVAAVVRYARRHGLSVAVNGQGGMTGHRESHSNYGQATAEGGIAIDAKPLAAVGAVGATGVDVEAGATWAAVTDAALAAGRTPPVLTDFLHLSVGGTLSAGGLGGTMQKVGSQADNVTELRVVTGTGEVVTCSATRNASLFEAVLAGVGQCGLIVGARVRLDPAPAAALELALYYDDLDAYLADQRTVMRDGRFSHQAGQIVPRPDGSGWRYMIEAAAYYSPPDAPDRGALLDGLADDRPSARVTEWTYGDWVRRLDARMAQLQAGGFWAEPHLWVAVLVPDSQVADFTADLTADLAPADMGPGPALFYPIRTSRITRPLFMVPDEPVAWVVALLRFPAPGTTDVARQLAQNRRIYDGAVARGGKQYLIGAVPDVGAADWRRHFGARWPGLAAAKARFDPDHVLTPGQGIFA